MNQLELHKKIREFTEKGFESANFTYLKNELFVNDDSKKYFYSRIDKNWIKPLHKAGFFDLLNQKSDDPKTISYRMPELAYLVSTAEEVPVEVTDVILDTTISEDNFNPEVIERYIWIISKLPIDQLKKVVKKMKDDEWVKLMSDFRKTGYEFDAIVESLVKENDEESLVDLLEAILLVSDKKEERSRDSIFYVNDVYASDIFVAISNVKKSENILKTLTFLLKQLHEATIKHGIQYNTGESAFDYDGPFSMYDKNLFEIEIEGKNAFSYNLDESNMLALIVDLFRKIDVSHVGTIAEELDKLPRSEITWKLDLVFLITHKGQFSAKIHTKLCSLFGYGDKYGSIFYGPEYKQALGMVISQWTTDKQKEYILESIELFKLQIENHLDQPWHLRNVVELFSIIYKSIQNEEIKTLVSDSIKKDFGSSIDEGYKPEPRYQKGTFGTVVNKSPFDITETSVSEIFSNLKTEWTPEKINEQFKDDEFLSPRSPEGLGNALKDNLKIRFDEYIECMLSESAYKDMHPHYVSALLRAFEDIFRDESKQWNIEEIESILKILITIKSQGVVDGDLSDKDEAWLGTWLTVKRSMADVLIYIIEPKDKELRKMVHEKNRLEILDLLKYLFATPESPNAKHEEPDYGDPFHVAINSVRGRVYQGFIVYVENDGKVLSDESKDFFKHALKDTSTAVRFVIGYYLPSIYYRDTKFVSGLFSKIFPDDLSDKLASWEGYLNQSLYKELYAELEDYYLWAMEVTPPERKYTKDINEVLSAHIALDFVHFQESHTAGLVWKFLEKKNVKQIDEFITFIGRSYINRDSATKESLDELPGGFNKFMNFWDWVIDQGFTSDAYKGFGFWVNDELIDSKILIDKIDKTFEVSNGAIDWDYKFEKSLVKFAEIDEQKTLNIIKNYLLEKDGDKYISNTNRRYPIFSIEGEIKSALEIIYKNPELKRKVVELINLLIENGGQVFWSLEDIL